jgi:hypothetical protein
MVQVPVKFSATCKFNLYEREGIVSQSMLVPRKKHTYLEPNSRCMQKTIGGLSVLAVFRVKNMQKNDRDKRL